MLASCGAKDRPPLFTNDTIMQEYNIIELVKQNNIDGVKKALDGGANINTRDTSNRSLLLLATISRYTEMATLLTENGADVNLQDNIRDSPFLYAGASGQTELVKLFLTHGARFDVFNRYNGSALIPACERGHVETVRLLANTKNYPINHVNRLGWTGLMEAVVLGDGSEKYQQIVQILKDAGADITIPDSDGITPLQHAKSRGFTAIVKILSSL
jgi:ankyrin repeat protein